jgi:membrane peptidoglycan carboxypeptidase
VFGKTGTTNDSADVWFTGCTRQICAATWVGHPRARVPMPGAYGGTVAAPIWREFMTIAMRGLPSQSIPEPPAPEQARVPNVVGLPENEAVDVLTRANFSPTAETVPSTEPLGIVTAQSPAGGSSATAGGPVTIQVSNGKVPSARVPGVIGLSAPAASNRLRSAGFQVAVDFRPTKDKSADGKVVSQSPGAGAKADHGSTVTIVVGRYQAPGGSGDTPGQGQGEGNDEDRARRRPG